MIKEILNSLFPAKCSVCGNLFYGEDQNVVCHTCLSSIKKQEPFYCKSCGSPFENCQTCLKKRKYQYIKVFTKRSDKIISIISTFKFDGIKPLGKYIAKLIEDDITSFVKENEIDTVTYIPLSKRIYRERGFNHLYEILKYIFPSYMIRDILYKNRETELQAFLSAEERRENMKNAFSLKESIKGKKVLVFDDILTTGSTMLEAYRAVKKGKPEGIFGYVITR